MTYSLRPVVTTWFTSIMFRVFHGDETVAGFGPSLKTLSFGGNSTCRRLSTNAFDDEKMNPSWLIGKFERFSWTTTFKASTRDAFRKKWPIYLGMWSVTDSGTQTPYYSSSRHRWYSRQRSTRPSTSLFKARCSNLRLKRHSYVGNNLTIGFRAVETVAIPTTRGSVDPLPTATKPSRFRTVKNDTK